MPGVETLGCVALPLRGENWEEEPSVRTTFVSLGFQPQGGMRR